MHRIAKHLQIASVRRSVVTIFPRYIASATTLFFNLGCRFIWFVILARSLGVAQFGELMVITGVGTIAATLCTLGSGDAMIRRVSRENSDYAQMLGHGLLLIGTIGIALVILAVLFLKLLIISPSVSATSVTLFSVANIMLSPFVGLAISAFLGLGDFRLANIIAAGSSLIELLTAAIAFLVFDVTRLDEWALWTVAEAVIIALACSLLLRRLGGPVWHIDRRELVLGFHYSTPNFIDALRLNVDRTVLGTVAPLSVLGSYATAMRITQMSQTVVNSLNRIVYPGFARRIDLGIRGSFWLAVVYVLVVTCLSATTACGVYLIAPYLPMLLGEPYRQVIFDLRVLCWLIVPMAIYTVPYDLLGALDQHGLRAKYYNSISLVGTAGTAFTIYLFGVAGAFVSVYVLQIVLSVGMWAVIVHAARDKGPAGRSVGVAAVSSRAGSSLGS